MAQRAAQRQHGTGWTSPACRASLALAALLGFGFAAPAHACDEGSYKVIVATGPIADTWANGSIICDETMVTLVRGDYLWVQNADEAIRMSGPAQRRIGKGDRQPAGIITMLSRYLDPKAWGIGAKKKRHGGARFAELA